MANSLTVEQIANIVNSAVKQATGQETLANIDTSKFVNVATTALKMGTDPLAIGLNQVMAQTIFAVRPYSRKFRSMEMSNEQYGNHVRKINFVDQDAVDDQGFPIAVTSPSPGTVGVANGNSVDPYVINLPEIVQTNFYGSTTYEFYSTFTREQLRYAFMSPESFNRFISSQMTHISNQREQRIENLTRGVVSNFIGATIQNNNTNQVVKLVTLYNAYAGTQLTGDTVRQPENFPAFAKWMFGFLDTLAGYLAERSTLYHHNFTGKPISRFTDATNLRMYLLNSFENSVSTEVLSDVFNEGNLKFATHERVNFWQSIESPDAISVTCSYTDDNGDVQTSEEVSQSDIIGVMFDRDAMGYSLFNQSADTTPMNARGRYYNTWWNAQYKYWNDTTENAVILLLE